MKSTVFLITATLLAGLACPAFARVEDYGPRRYTQVGHGRRGGHETIDRRGGPGWTGAIVGGILGAAAGLALGQAAPPPVVYGPPVIGTVVPYPPPGCITEPAYNGGVVYDCGNIYYQPFYEGTSLMYQVVPAP